MLPLPPLGHNPRTRFACAPPLFVSRKGRFVGSRLLLNLRSIAGARE